MQISSLPTPLQQLKSRPFSFYPPILGVRHNQWIFGRATWSEVVVVNRGSGEEAVIPRMFIGEVSIVDDPVVIVGLRRELEWNNGMVAPRRRAVVELPIAVNGGSPAAPHPGWRAPVVGIRLEPPPEKRTGRKIAAGLMLGSVACLLAANIQIHRHPWDRLNPADDYSSAVRKLGAPATDRFFTAPGGRAYRTLSYPSKNFTLVLMGPANGELHYAGAVDPQGRVLDARIPQLRSVHRF